MKRRKAARRHLLFPDFSVLESRRLLSITVVSYGEDGTDVTGPSMSPGPDGNEDIHLYLTGLQSEVSSITISDSTGKFQWAYYDGQDNNGQIGTYNSAGVATAAFFQPFTSISTPSSYVNYGNLYISQDVNVASGTLGSATGTVEDLASGATLTIQVDYAGGQSPDTWTGSVGSLPSTPTSMPPTSAPTNVVTDPGGVSVTDDNQDNSLTTVANGIVSGPIGFVHLQLTGLTGNLATVQLSDQGEESPNWTWSSSVNSTDDLPMQVIQSPGASEADVYFAPIRDETNAINSCPPNADMFLNFTYKTGSNSDYFVSFPGGHWNPALMAQQYAPNGTRSDYDGITDTIPANLTASQAASRFVADVTAANTNSAPDVITLAAGLPTIVLTQPLPINHPIQIIGNGNTVDFQASNWASDTPGAIYLGFGNQHMVSAIDIEDLTINFNGSSVIPWFDPYNDVDSNDNVIRTAVINLATPYSSEENVLTLNDVQVYGPPAYNPWPEGNQAPGSGTTYLEPAMNLVTSNSNDTGSITNCTFQGGPVQVSSGPWTISYNTSYGAFNGTASSGAFSLQGPHDVDFTYNVANQDFPGKSSPYGQLFRLVNLADTSFDDTISNNTFQGGYYGDEGGWDSETDQTNGNGVNDPEAIIAEGNYTNVYEGPGIVSSNGYVLTLPLLSDSPYLTSPVAAFGTGASGWVASIINAQNPDGSSNSYAGTYELIAQLISTSPVSYYLETPLPTNQYSSNFTFAISNGFVGDQYLDNTVNISGPNVISTGLQLSSQYGTIVEGNTIVGSPSINTNWTNNGIILRADQSNASGSSPATLATNQGSRPGDSIPTSFPLPKYWAIVPSFGFVVEGNTIENSPGGLNLALGTSDTNHQGRVYLTATLGGTSSGTSAGDYNTFEYTSNFLSQWNALFYGYNDGSGTSNSSYDNYMPPTISLNGEGAGRENHRVNPTTFFDDPDAVDVTLSGNVAEENNSGSITTLGGEGQVLAAVVNGVSDTMTPTQVYTSSTVVRQSGEASDDTTPYIDYNFSNLDIMGISSSPPPVPPAVPLEIAFTESGQSVASGYTAVTNGTIYSSTQSYGFSSSDTTLGSEPGAVYAKDMTYLENVPDGYYNVALTIGGGQSAFLYLQGSSSYSDILTAAAGASFTETYLVDVTDGQLSLRLLPTSSGNDVYINALTLTPRAFPVEFQFGPGDTTVAAGRDQVSNFTDYNSALGYGFTASSGLNAHDGSPGRVTALSMTFREDLPNGTYLVTPTLLGTGNSGDAVDVYVQGAEVATLSTVSGSVSGSYLAVVSGGYLTLGLTGVTNDGAAIASLAVLPLQFIANPTSPSSSPGLTPITNGTIYSATTGYGFSSSDTTLGSSTGAVYASDMTFLVNLPDGYYDVTATVGGGESGVYLYLQGSTSSTDMLTTPSGASLSQPYLVDVTDGQLSFRLVPPSGSSVYLNGLTIVPQAFPLQFQFAPGGSVPSAGYDAASNFTLYSTQSHYGFTSATQNMNSASGSPGWVYAKDMTFQVDIPNGIYIVTPTLLGTGHSGDGAYVYLQGTEVGTMPAASGAVTDSYTVTVSNGTLTLRLLEMTADGVAISKLTIARSSQQQDGEVAMSVPMEAKTGRREGPTVAPGTGPVVPVVGAATPSGPGGAAFFCTPIPPAPSAPVVVGDVDSGSPREKSPSITVLTDDNAVDLDGIAVFEFENESSPAAPSLPASKKQRGN